MKLYQKRHLMFHPISRHLEVGLKKNWAVLRFLTPHVETLCVVLDILLITPFILECLLTFDSGQQVIFILKEHSRLKTKNRLREVSLFLQI